VAYQEWRWSKYYESPDPFSQCDITIYRISRIPIQAHSLRLSSLTKINQNKFAITSCLCECRILRVRKSRARGSERLRRLLVGERAFLACIRVVMHALCDLLATLKHNRFVPFYFFFSVLPSSQCTQSRPLFKTIHFHSHLTFISYLSF